MDPMLILLIVFVALSLLLFKSKHERHLVFFMIRTKLGVKLIDRIAKFAPSFWKLVGDLAILVSFSGLGAYYLSGRKESRGNLYSLLMGLVFLAVLMSPASILIRVIAVAVLAVVVHTLWRRESRLVNYVVTSLLITVITNAYLVDIKFSLFLGFLGLPALIIAALISQAIEIVQGSMLPGVSPMIPTTQDGNLGVTFPGYDIFIPWWYALIAIIATLVPHEMAHGILARVHHIKVKSTGLLTAGALPIGAFVEPDEEQLNDKPSVEKTRMYAVGSLANFTTGLLCMLVLVALTSAYMQIAYVDGVKVMSFHEGYPAENYLPAEAILYNLNGVNLTSISAFEDAASVLKPGSNVRLETDWGVIEFQAAVNPNNAERGYMGLIVQENIIFSEDGIGGLLTPQVLFFIVNALNWIIFFNLAIGSVNLLPIPPFDGYKIIDEIIKTSGMRKEDIKWVIYTLIITIAVVLMLNLFPLIKMALNPILEYFGL